MKIAIIDQRNTPYRNDIIQGGIESVIKMQLRLLAENNIVYFITSCDSDMCDRQNVFQKCLSTHSRYVSDLQGRKYNDKRNADIHKFLNEISPDIVINHDQSNNSVAKLLGKLSFPSITYMHNTPEVIGGMAGLSYIETLKEYSDSGGMLLPVSKSSMGDWKRYYRKYSKHNPETILTDYHYTPVIFDDYEVQLSNGKIGMLSRISEDKKIHIALKLLKDADHAIHLFHTRPRNDNEKTYFNQVCEVVTESERSCDLDRETLLTEIGKLSYLIVAGPESFGLVAFEANMLGVPVILLNSKEEHSVLEACSAGLAYGSVVHCKDTRNKNAVIQFLKALPASTIERRANIAKETKNTFTKNAAYGIILNIFWKAIEKHKSSSLNTLY